jgi:putative endonuclease
MVHEERQYSIYILYSSHRDRYYVGHSQSFLDRIENYHNAGRSTYTQRGIPWKLVYSKIFTTRAHAMNREREIKLRKSRTYIEKVVQSVPSRS